jgi:hypothetical protein
VTAHVLGGHREPPPLVGLLCAIFNLGIGLIDGLCDEDAGTGGALLELIRAQDLVEAAEAPRGRGWLGGALAPALAEDHTVAFAAVVVETFFETLHAAYPGDLWLQHRREVGTQLEAALEAEQRSVVRRAVQVPLEELIECSRATSVLPFGIVHSLAAPAGDRGAATLLGEAMWRIDDLVDLCQDARTGALNGVLLTATTRPEGSRDVVAALESLRTSTTIAGAATQAAQDLLAGLVASDDRPRRSFLYFIHRYAGIAPRPPRRPSAPAGRSPRPGGG